MNTPKINSIKKSNKSYRVKRPTQTGFSSPATHYTEPRIDLNEVLVKNSSATFFFRVADNAFEDYNIVEKDVLIIDKSLEPQENQLVVAVIEDSFRVIRIQRTQPARITVWGVITYIIKSTL